MVDREPLFGGVSRLVEPALEGVPPVGEEAGDEDPGDGDEGPDEVSDQVVDALEVHS